MMGAEETQKELQEELERRMVQISATVSGTSGLAVSPEDPEEKEEVDNGEE